MSNVQLMMGDCLEQMKSIPDASVDMVLCDLPYGTTACKWDTIIPFDQLWDEYSRIVKRDAPIVLTASQPFTSALVMSNPKWFRYEWVWEKSTGTGHAGANKRPMKCHESVLVFGKKSVEYFPQKTPGKPYKPTKGATPGESSEFSTGSIRNGSADGSRFHRSVQYFKDAKYQDGQLHPTQKPVALMEYLIRTYTNEGMTVLDNCMGSGTTGVACVNTGRSFIGIERDEKYFNIAKERINKSLDNNNAQ